jgi:hypothetical protein
LGLRLKQVIFKFENELVSLFKMFAGDPMLILVAFL